MINEYKIAKSAVLKAGKILLDYYSLDYNISNKNSKKSDIYNPVTDADKAADKYLRTKLTTSFPDYGWFSEETKDSNERLKKERVWIVDPLDGTKEYINKIPMWVVSVALVENKKPILGIIYNPIKKQIFSAIKGEGSKLNNTTIFCTKNHEISKMTILNSITETKNGLWIPFKNNFGKLKEVGSVAYKLGLVSSGKADLFATLRPKNEWDICAGHCIINEAGGKMLDLNGKKISYNNPKSLITPGMLAGYSKSVDNAITILSGDTIL